MKEAAVWGVNVMADRPACARLFSCERSSYHPQLETEENVYIRRRMERHWKSVSPFSMRVCIHIWVHFSPRAGRAPRTRSFSLHLTQCEKGLGSSPSFNNSSFSIITKDLALAAVQHRTGSYSKAEGRGLVVTKWRQVEDHRISPLFHTYSQYVWESGWCEHSATPFQSTKMRRATAWHDVPGERRPGLAHHVLLHNSKPPPTT